MWNTKIRLMELKVILLFILVLASDSNYFKVVLSQYSGFPSSFSPGSSFTLPASYGWHKNENGGLSFGNSDVFRSYSPLSKSSQSDRNFDELGISNERTRNLMNVLEEIKKNNWNNEDMRNKIEVFKPRSSNVEWRTGNSDETESTTSKSTSRRTSTTQKTTTRKKTTTKRTTRYTPPPHYEVFHNYGNTFGDRRLLENTYIARKDFFEERPPIGPGPLVKALFSKGHVWGFSDSHNPLNSSRWDRYADKRWRTTTKAPYFENKVPAEDKILPASVVTGAATAFGLVSLFPLIVLAFKPLMYCGNINLKQLTIRINDENSYTCNEVDNSFEILCPGNFRNQMNYHCMNKKLQCDLKFSEIQGNVFCRDGILYSKSNMYCTSTTTIKSRIDTLSILECQEGQIASHLGSFIPTTTPSSRHFLTSSTTTTPKPLSFGAKIHLFILKLMGKYDAVNQETTEVPEYPSSNEFAWHPIPLSIPIETTTLTTKINQISSESESKEASEEVTIEEAPYEWMRIVTYPNNEKRLEPVPKQLVEIAEKAPKSEIPADWMKVLISNRSGS